jgi:ABC-type nitrate/sulfonate/bicarbonate transport system ATPase subunit
MRKKLIDIKNLSRIFPATEGLRRVEVLKNINLTIHEGEFLVLLGPSGCGKSTLLRILSGLDEKTGGEIIYADTYDETKVGFVFQNFGILPWLTVFKNVELNLLERMPRELDRKNAVDKILKVFELSAFRDHTPHDLSGGMKQRVGLARAFVSSPDIIFLDEPFSELDFFTAQNLRKVLLELWEIQHTTVVMVSHYVDEAVALADRIVVFSDRPGTVLDIVENTLPRPRNPRSKEFFALEDTALAQLERKRG